MRLLAFLILLIPTLALANDPDIPDILSTWEPPTQYSDNTALPISDIEGYMITEKYNDELPEDIFIPGALSTEYVTVDAKKGTYIFAVAAVIKGERHKINLSTITLQEPAKEVKEVVVTLRLSCDNCGLEVR